MGAVADVVQNQLVPFILLGVLHKQQMSGVGDEDLYSLGDSPAQIALLIEVIGSKHNLLNDNISFQVCVDNSYSSNKGKDSSNPWQILPQVASRANLLDELTAFRENSVVTSLQDAQFEGPIGVDCRAEHPAEFPAVSIASEPFLDIEDVELLLKPTIP